MSIRTIERRKKRINLDHIFSIAIKVGATDIHLHGGMAPMMRLNGDVLPVENENMIPLENSTLKAFAEACFTDEQKVKFRAGEAIDWNYRQLPKLGTFRLNASLASGQAVITIRPIKHTIPTFESLCLPPILEKIANMPRGLVLFVGTTGSGKSSSLAAMINHISTNQNLHIVTIEDPIEFKFPKAKGIISQKEIGSDVTDFKSALRASLRQDPDVIMVGEMRDKETIDTALLAAETGHLVFATLHTTDTAETINRIVSTYDSTQQQQIRHQLASVLKAVVGQRLVPREGKRGLIPAVEVMFNTERIRDMILNPEKTKFITSAIEEGNQNDQMQSFDQSLIQHLTTGKISYDTALAYSSYPNEFALRCRGVQSVDGGKWDQFESSKTAIFGLSKDDHTLLLEVRPDLEAMRQRDRYSALDLGEDEIKELLAHYDLQETEAVEAAAPVNSARAELRSEIPGVPATLTNNSHIPQNPLARRPTRVRKNSHSRYLSIYKNLVTASLVLMVSISRFWASKN